MKTKPGVDIRFLRQEIVRYLPNIEAIVLWHACKVFPGFQAVITSGNDSQHGPASLHYKNRAIDIRTRESGVGPEYGFAQLTRMVRRAIVADLKRLNPDFDVVDEVDHIHLEHDPS